MNSVAIGRVSISPAEDRVAFSSGNQITIYNIQTRELKTVVAAGKNPAWAPDGNRIAYDDGQEVHAIDLQSGATTNLGKGTEPSWSSSSTVAVHVGFDKIYSVDLYNKKRQLLLHRRSISSPRWADNGRWLAYSYHGGGAWWSLADRVYESHQIIVKDTQTGVETAIGRYYKANAGDYSWVTNQTLCHGDFDGK